MMGRLSLRTRLSVVLVAVVAVALAVGNVAVYAFASHFLDQRVDEQLTSLTGPAAGIVFRVERGREQPPSDQTGRDPGGFRTRALPVDLTGAYVEARTPDGRRIEGRYLLSTSNDQRTPPDLPAVLVVGPGSEVLFDTTATDADRRLPYRVRASALPDGSVVVTALPTSDVDTTRQRLVLIELAATLTVLAGVAGLTWWLVGVGLRPLARMERTAERIADGDLSQRVEPSSASTEIGRLGAALNGMLTEIEQAFAAKETSERKLRRFVADASHELRTPLTSIRGYAELLRRGTVHDPAEVAAAAQRIESESTRMGTLVDDLLLLARLDEGIDDAEREPVELAEVATSVVEDARVVEPGRPIALELGPAVWVEGDRGRLTQVATNLVTNARVHTPPGTAIEVVARAGRPDHGEAAADAVLEVIDHGSGIDPAAVGQVFDRFYRADASRSRRSGGSGLGLAIVAAIVDAHGGRCEVRETPGGGATFRVVLPATAHTAPPPSPPATPARPAAAGAARTSARPTAGTPIR